MSQCGGSDTELLYEMSDWYMGLAGCFRQVRCRACGLTYVNPRPGPTAIGAYYPSAYLPMGDYAKENGDQIAQACAAGEKTTVDNGAGNLTAEKTARYSAIDSKTKRLMAMAIALGAGCRNCVLSQAEGALELGATKEEFLETISVVSSMRGTTGVAESLRVIQFLDELGKL